MLANGMKQRTADRPLVAALACRTTCRWAASWPILERMTIHQNAESFPMKSRVLQTRKLLASESRAAVRWHKILHLSLSP